MIRYRYRLVYSFIFLLSALRWKWKLNVNISNKHSACIYGHFWVDVFVIEGGCGAFIAPSWSGTIALFWPVSPEGGSSIRRSRHSVCQQGLVWDWVSTATWSSEHRNAIVPPFRLWPDQAHMQTHTDTHKQTHACTHTHTHTHTLHTQYARGAPAGLHVLRNLGQPALLCCHYLHK